MHCIFSTKDRAPFIDSDLEARLWPYIGGIARENRIKALAIDKVRALPPDKQQEALKLLDTLFSEVGSEPEGTAVHRRPIWEIVEEVNAGLPPDTWDDVPTDGSTNLDHYLYGA